MIIKFNKKLSYNKTVESSIIHFLNYLIPRYKNYIVFVEYFSQKDDNSDYWLKGELQETEYRNFILKLNEKMNINAIIRTVAHECVHLKQSITEKPCTWNFDKKSKNSFQKYMLDSQELEAYALTEFLFLDLIQKNKKLDKRLYIDYDFKNL
jgi:hypothetical protein